MFRWLVRRRIAAFEREFGYDLSYGREILDQAGLGAFLRFAQMQPLGTYRADVPLTPWFAAKVAAAVVADCGPCVQLVVTMALRAGVPAAVLSSVLRSDDVSLPTDVRVAVAFARASLHRAPDLERARLAVLESFGQRGLVSLAFAITAATLYPTLKVALGHGTSCALVTLDGAAIPVVQAA
jgi:alkylhydroperoxidase family enzyme